MSDPRAPLAAGPQPVGGPAPLGADGAGLPPLWTLHDRLCGVALLACVCVYLLWPELDLRVARLLWTPGRGFVRVGDVTNDAQSQPGAAVAPVPCCLASIEGIKQSFALGFWNAGC